MAGRGFAPSNNRARERDNKDSVKLVADGRKRGVNLPQLRKDGRVVKWHPRTVSWWNNWRISPQATRMMTGPDWDYMLDTALVHHTMWSEGRLELAGEVRLRLQKFGATPEDRSRLRVEIGVELPYDRKKTTESGSSSNVTSIDDRRSRLTSAPAAD